MSEGRRYVVLHEGYGCDTGCCGHVVRFADGNKEKIGTFEFSHCGGKTDAELREYADDLLRGVLGEEHVKDLDFENSKIYAYDRC